VTVSVTRIKGPPERVAQRPTAMLWNQQMEQQQQ